jgi:hypothetical protein
VIRTCVSKTNPGDYQRLEHEGNYVYIICRPSGVAVPTLPPLRSVEVLQSSLPQQSSSETSPLCAVLPHRRVCAGAQGVCVADMEYPQRVAFAIITKLLEDFTEQNGGKVSQDKADNCMPFPALDDALQRYQDPAAADKITRIQKDLEETKQVLAPPCPHCCSPHLAVFVEVVDERVLPLRCICSLTWVFDCCD